MEVRINVDGEDKVIALPAPRTFSSGSRGFYFTDKTIIDGKRYQVAVTMTEIGSKPKA